MKINAAAFKAKRLKLSDEVAATHEPLVITKRGAPVAGSVPIGKEKPRGLFRYMEGAVTIHGNIFDVPPKHWAAETGEEDHLYAPFPSDSNTKFWHAEGTAAKGKPGGVSQIENALLTNHLHISAFGSWQIGLVGAKNHLTLSTPARDRTQHAPPGLSLQPPDWQGALESTLLPSSPHAAPAGRLLAATARVGGQTRHVNVLAA